MNRFFIRKSLAFSLTLPLLLISGITLTAPAAHAATDSQLTNLSVSSTTLSPTFDSGTYSYTASLDTNTSLVGVTPTFGGVGETATVNGVLTSSDSSTPVTLVNGVNTITVIAYAPDGTSNTYTVTISLYTVSYLLNNATSGSVPISETVTVNSPYIVTFNSGNLKRTGFRFLGWGDNASDGSGVIYRPGIDTLTITANTVLYAKWDNPYGFGLYLDQPFVQNSYVYDPADSATALDSANGYALGNCPSNLAIGTITSGTGCKVEADGLYGGASTDTSTQTVGGTGTNFFGSRLGGFTITFPTPQTYFGMWWSGGSVSDTIEFLNGTTVLATMTTASLATLLAPSGYPIAEANAPWTFPVGSITAPNTVVYPKGHYFGKPSIFDTVTPTTFPSTYGTLSGGYTSKITTAYLYAYIHAFGQGGITFTGVRLTGGSFEFDNMVTSSKTLTPSQELILTESKTASSVVNFDRNGSTSSVMAGQSSSIPVALSTNTYTRSGFTFGGWNTKADGTGRALAGGAEYSFDGGITLYAVWIPNISTPTIGSISPVSGSTAGATSITITGTNFAAGAAVTVGGNACTSVVVVSATSITCNTPAGSAGAKDVVVTNSDTGSATSTGGFTYITPISTPTIGSISPVSGSTAGATSITITGTNFAAGAAVTVDGNACTSVVVVSATSITCNTPAGSAGAKDVVVTNSDTGSATSAGGFTYITPIGIVSITSISPKKGSIKGGTEVTITGVGFSSGATVKVDGVTAVIIKRTGSTKITIRTPKHAKGVVSIVVTNPDTGFATFNSFTYTSEEESKKDRDKDDSKRDR